MQKFCIFCGNHPESKNKEHVLPQWLIKMTGNPKRVVVIGKKDGKEIKFPWTNYVFPSCEKCNSDFAEIEAKVKTVVEKLINETAISHPEFDLLLDWIDKIRIGVWLGHAQLYNKDFKPNFYINQRVGSKDRLCLFYKIDDDEEGIGITGTETEIFEHIPSCFALTINNLAIFNYSNDFIFSKNLGFPYPKDYFYHANGMIRVDEVKNGMSKITLPLLSGKIIKPSIKFYQSILTGNHQIQRPKIGKTQKFFDMNGMHFNKNQIKSRIYLSDELSNNYGFWDKKAKYIFKFHKKFDRQALMYSLAKIVFEHQIISAKEAFNHLQEYDEEKRESFINHYKYIIEQNQRIVEKLDEALKPIIKNI